jgi:hypothetical protein
VCGQVAVVWLCSFRAMVNCSFLGFSFFNCPRARDTCLVYWRRVREHEEYPCRHSRDLTRKACIPTRSTHAHTVPIARVTPHSKDSLIHTLILFFLMTWRLRHFNRLSEDFVTFRTRWREEGGKYDLSSRLLRLLPADGELKRLAL